MLAAVAIGLLALLILGNQWLGSSTPALRCLVGIPTTNRDGPYAKDVMSGAIIAAEAANLDLDFMVARRASDTKVRAATPYV